MSEQGYRGPQVCKIVGITYRQLDYWTRTELIRASLADAKGSGTQRLYSYKDLVELKVIKSLLDLGVKLPKARAALEYLREELGEDVASANLVINGTGSILARNGDELIDIVRKGQTVFSVVALGNVEDEVKTAIRDLRPEVTETGSGDAPVSLAN